MYCIKVDKTNLNKYFDCYDGALYYRTPDTKVFKPLLSSTIEECLIALKNGTEFIYVEEDGLSKPLWMD